MIVCIRFISLSLLSTIMKICISQMWWRLLITYQRVSYSQHEIRLHIVNHLNAELNPICHFLALLEAPIFSTLAGYGLMVGHEILNLVCSTSSKR
jgi:hypothetical protein